VDRTIGAGLVVGKGVVVALLTRLTGYDNEIACRTGTVLAQGGEFGLALLALALLTGLLSFEASQPILAAVVISMLLAPLLIRYNGPLAKALFAKLSLARPCLRHSGSPLRLKDFMIM